MHERDFEAISETLTTVFRKESFRCLKGETHTSFELALKRAQSAVEIRNQGALADAIEDSILCLVHGMGHDISAHDAEQVIDGLFPQAISVAGGEGRAYAVALPYVERLFLLRDLAGAEPDDSFEPKPELFPATLSDLRNRIDGLCLATTDRAALLEPLKQLEKLSKQDLSKNMDAVEDAMASYFQRVGALESIAFTPVTANYLRGRILLSGPAVVCLFGFTIPAQILAALLAVVIGGIYFAFQSGKAKRAFKRTNATVGDLTKTGKQLDTAIDTETNSLDVDEIDEIIKGLIKRRANLKKDPTINKKQRVVIKRRLDRAIKRYQKNRAAKEADTE